ncbi:MAG: L-threonylcarbamoyladenylate synthase [Fimbriimonas sp.]
MKIVPPTLENLLMAGEAIRRGELVGMPTETVYGIAADALNPDAVRRTFEAKGRPSDNPLIVHLSDVTEVDRVAADFPLAAAVLAQRYWPGPLTLVLPKQEEVPDVVTAGLDTVAVRVPDHPVARALIEAAGTPVSAPSANPFMGLSPTRAEDIPPSIAEHLTMILDGGPCEIGLESTVADVRRRPFRLLRPGRISREELEVVLEHEVLGRDEEVKRSPGQYARHYAPRTPVRLAERLEKSDAGITFGAPQNSNQISLPQEPVTFGAALYATLHDLDRRGLPEIVVEAPPADSAWEAVWDRLRRATG